jgi:hypothetical protein
MSKRRPDVLHMREAIECLEYGSQIVGAMVKSDGTPRTKQELLAYNALPAAEREKQSAFDFKTSVRSCSEIPIGDDPVCGLNGQMVRCLRAATRCLNVSFVACGIASVECSCASIAMRRRYGMPSMEDTNAQAEDYLPALRRIWKHDLMADLVGKLKAEHGEDSPLRLATNPVPHVGRRHGKHHAAAAMLEAGPRQAAEVDPAVARAYDREVRLVRAARAWPRVLDAR